MALAKLRPRSPLDALLARARQDSVEFPVLLANHLPMALTGLERLGASAGVMEHFADRYRDTNGLVPPPPPVAALDDRTWTEALGRRERETDARVFFAQQIAGRGSAAVLADALPVLQPGIGASALHAFMRLAYGLLRHDPDEIGTALGYWTVTFLRLPAPVGPEAPLTTDPAEVLARVAALPGLTDVVPESDLLWHNVRAVASSPAFRPVAGWLAVDDTTPSRIAATSLALFAGTMDFAALHALTGSHWLRLVLPHCADPAGLIRAFWQVIAALVPKIGCQALPDALTLARWRQAPCPDWTAIVAAASASNDEHDISLVFSAREEERHWGDRLYRVVAARRMGLVE